MEKEKKAPGILIFAGTTEGRLLAEYAAGISARCFACTATEYGKNILSDLSGIEIHAGRMDREEIRHYIVEKEIDLVIDATHPFAQVVTENIKEACDEVNADADGTDEAREAAVRYVRCLREQTDGQAQRDGDGSAVTVGSVSEAVSFLKKTEGNILIATGSKELHHYTEIDDYGKRCFARVLSTQKAVEESVRLGFEGRHLIAMQGPFSVEMNLALLRQTKASWFVTKESGTAGGFEEKLKAARMAGATAVIVGRPQETGESVKTVKEMMRRLVHG